MAEQSNNDISVGGHNANVNDECKGDCAMLNYNMMTDCIMYILLCRDPLINPCFHSFKRMGPVDP